MKALTIGIATCSQFQIQKSLRRLLFNIFTRRFHRKMLQFRWRQRMQPLDYMKRAKLGLLPCHDGDRQARATLPQRKLPIAFARCRRGKQIVANSDNTPWRKSMKTYSSAQAFHRQSDRVEQQTWNVGALQVHGLNAKNAM